MTSIDDGFGGFTRGFLENVRDEYPKTSILTFGISNSNSPASMVMNNTCYYLESNNVD
jgi:hypothetical protein